MDEVHPRNDNWISGFGVNIMMTVFVILLAICALPVLLMMFPFCLVLILLIFSGVYNILNILKWVILFVCAVGLGWGLGYVIAHLFGV